MKKALTLLSFLISSTLFSQYLGYSPIDDADVSKWVPKIELEYYGTYHFGDSEAESTLYLFYSGTEMIAQIESGAWNEDATDWIWIYDNLTNVSIDKEGNFNSDQYKGEFAFYSGAGERKKCLKIYDSWSGATENPGEYELGYRTGAYTKTMYAGEYPEASTRELIQEELKKLSPDELQIMRNEIFARYGYTFKKGGKMEAYFKKQTWYKPQHTDVNGFLTSLEKRNIRKIRAQE